MNDGMRESAAELHAELVADALEAMSGASLSSLARARAKVEFRRRLDERLSCFRPDEPADIGDRAAILQKVFSAFVHARRQLGRGIDQDIVTRGFQEEVREALQPKLF